MNGKVLKLILLGACAYALFVFLVMSFYPDKPENMDWQDREEYNKVQITKLKDAGYIEVEKSFRDNYPLTTCRMTGKGIKAFETYVEAITTYLKPGGK